MLTGMPCLERARLLRLYAQATSELSELVRKLSESVALEREEFDRAWEQCESARHLCTQLQDQIYQHLREHRCALDVTKQASKRNLTR
jgi:hypothetical protein